MTEKPTSKQRKLMLAERLVERIVWECNLESYSEHVRANREIEQSKMTAHERLLAKAQRYLQKLDVTRPDHAAAVSALGTVITLAGTLATEDRSEV